MNLEAVADALVRRRNHRGMHKTEVARRAGVSTKTIDNLEGRLVGSPTKTTLAKLSQAMDWPSDALWLHGQDDPSAPPPDANGLEDRVARLEGQIEEIARTLSRLASQGGSGAPGR